jgi:hypothetical protein
MAGQEKIMLQVSQGGAWYDGEAFDVGDRVAIVDPAERARLGAGAGRVVGYDPSGPLPGESFLRVLVQPDTAEPMIVALPPTAVGPEDGSERIGLARNLLASLEPTMRPERFQALVSWLAGPACAELVADPQIRRRRVRLGGFYLPGLVLPELAELASRRLQAK